jgi:transposase
MTKNHLKLKASDLEHLQHLTSQNSLSVGVWRRAQGLLLLHEGQTLQSVASCVGVCYLTVAQWRDRYKQEGLALLQDKPKAGRAPRIDGQQRAKITALACSTPPEGHARWSVRLLADKAVELGYIESISHDSVHQILKKTNSNPT